MKRFTILFLLLSLSLVIKAQTPAITDITASTCSGAVFSNTPVDAVNGTVPVGSTYSWASPIVTGGMTGGASASDQSSISGTLSNPTLTAQTATYTVTPSANGSTGTTFKLIITVNPTSALNGGYSISACSGKTLSVSMSSQMPAGTLFSWAAPKVTGGMTGGTGENGLASFFSSLDNPTSSNQTATYTVTPTSGTCIGRVFDVQAVVYPNPVSNAGTGGTITCTQNTSGIQLGASSTSGYTYLWTSFEGLSNNKISNPVATPTATTTYTLSTSNNYGCKATSSVVVTVIKAIPTANAGSNSTIGCNQNLSGVQLGAVSVNGSSYTWSPSTRLSNSNASNPTATPTITTTYTLTENNSSGCSASNKVVVTVINGNAPLANAGGNKTISCSENTGGVQLGAASISGNSYTWTPSTGLSSSNISNPMATPTVTTTYTLTETTGGGCTASNSIIVTVVGNIPYAKAGTSASIGCNQNLNGVQLGTSAVNGNTYAWTPAAGLNNSALSNPIANPSSTTTYTLTESSTSGCTATNSVVVTVISGTTPIANAGPNTAITCVMNAAFLGTSNIGGMTYSWSPSFGLSNSSISNPIATPPMTTLYTLTVTNSANNCTATSSVMVMVDKILPAATAGSSSTISCTQNTNGIQLGTSSTSGYTYSWMPSTGLSSASVSNPTANPSTNTTYSITTTNTNNGCSSSNNVVVTVNKNIPIATAGSNATIGCTSNVNGVQLGTASVAGNTYSWSPTTALSSALISNPTASPTVATTYTLIVANTQTSCTASNSVVVFYDKSIPTDIPNRYDTIDCVKNKNGVLLNKTVIQGQTYNWSDNGGFTSTQNNPLVKPLNSTTYVLTVTKTSSGCTAMGNVIVFVFPCDSLGSKDTVVRDTIGFKKSNQIAIQMDTCIFDYSMPLDSFAIINYNISQNNLILHMAFYQNKNEIKLDVSIPLDAIKQGNNLLKLTINCSHNKSLNSGHSTTFILGLEYTVTGVRLNAPDITCFPNPVTDKINIHVQNTQNSYCYVEIYNANGLKVKSERFNTNQYTMDVSDISSGIYVLKIYGENGNFIHRFVKIQ